jgi:hypothetical protein
MTLTGFWFNRAKRAESERDVLLWLHAELKHRFHLLYHRYNLPHCDQCEAGVVHYHEGGQDG